MLIYVGEKKEANGCAGNWESRHREDLKGNGINIGTELGIKMGVWNSLNYVVRRIIPRLFFLVSLLLAITVK
jgi:hypothetical protein